mmetsp:Transcript_3693/g.7939  ORF Transcript_3693/g.7939 Transcript_3693/m.7939 type:complete len:262 (-) Transcript_3693:3341-4126(-)
MNDIATIRNDRLQTATTSGESSSAALMDSLPYVETVHEDYEEYALALIEEEMKAIVSHPEKKKFPMNFRTPVMQAEYNTLVVMEGDTEGGDAPALVFRDRSKEQFQEFQHAKIVKPTTTEEWTKTAVGGGGDALSQIKARFEAERIRSLVLEVEKEEGVANWKEYNARLDDLGAFWAKSLKQQMDAVEEINFRRQQAQTQQVGPEIDRLNEEYEQALYRRNQMEYSIEGLKRETNINNAGDSSSGGDAASRKRKVDGDNAQ